MDALEFLKSKNMIKEGFTKFIISGDFGKIDLGELLNEFLKKSTNENEIQAGDTVMLKSGGGEMSVSFVSNCYQSAKCY